MVDSIYKNRGPFRTFQNREVDKMQPREVNVGRMTVLEMLLSLKTAVSNLGEFFS